MSVDTKKVVVIKVGSGTSNVSDQELDQRWISELTRIPGVEPVLRKPGHFPTPQELSDLVDADASAVLGAFVASSLLTEDFFDAHPKLEYYAGQAHGYEAMDFSGTRARGITVVNTPYGANTVAEYAFALLMEVYHHVAQRDAMVRSTDWQAPEAPHYMRAYPTQDEAFGKTIGIFGFGKIGHCVARIANGFGMRVLACDRYVTNPPEYVTMVDFDELLAESDVLTLHASLNPSTKNLINDEAIAKMRDGAVLINTSRGGLVDEEALARALKSGKLMGAGLDVLQDEPPLPTNPLLSCENAVITNHVAWLTRGSRLRQVDVAVETYQAFLEGHPINVINAVRE